MKFKIISLLILFAASCGKNGTSPEPEPAPHFTSQPAVQNLQPTLADIAWNTDINANSVVRYGTESGQYAKTQTKDVKETAHVIRLAPLESNTTYYYVAESQTTGGKITSGEGQFTTLQTLDQLVQSGWENYESGNLLTAIANFSELLNRSPSANQMYEAYNGLGWSYAANSVDSLDKAVESFQSALQIDFNAPEALTGMGFVHLALKKYKPAADDLAQVIALAPNFVFSHNADITIADVRLGLAEADFFRQLYSEAQNQVNVLAPSNGLDANNSATWTVNSVQYNSYTEALLAWIEALKSTLG